MTGDQAYEDLWAFMEPERPDDDRWVGPPEDEAKRLRDLGAAQALDHADSRGRAAGEQAIRDLAASGREFSSDDVHELVGHPLGCSSAVMGSLILTAAKAGIIEHVSYQPSKRVEAHGRTLKTWRGTGRTPDQAVRGVPGRPSVPCGASDVPTGFFPPTPEGSGGPGPPPPAPPDRPGQRLGGPGGSQLRAGAGTWTAAEVAKPCVDCRAPAFMRDPEGRPRHKAECRAS